MTLQALNTWDQIAPRAHQRQCFCFPFAPNGSFKALEDHLRIALDGLAAQHPYLTGRVSLLPNNSGLLGISQSNWTIPLVISDHRDSFEWTYDQLRCQGFPAKAFVDPSWDLPNKLESGSSGSSVFEVHGRAIVGGLLLSIYSHHSVLDGTAVHDIVSSLARLTRDSSTNIVMGSAAIKYEPMEDIQATTRSPDSVIFLEQLVKCPEYCLLDSATGPTQFRMPSHGTPWNDICRTGRIFFISQEKINNLKRQIGRNRDHQPSSFTLLAALSWAHVTRARLNSPKNLLPSDPSSSIDAPDTVRLMVASNWRSRAFQGCVRSSPGNAVALPKTALNKGEVLVACGNSEENVLNLARLTEEIDSMIAKVDEDFVSARTALFRAASDIRLIGMDADPRDPRDFYFNSWRHFGGDTRWKLPGVSAKGVDGSLPDAIRRLQADWNMGAGLILPAREDRPGFEVLVTLDIDAMNTLCSDADWQSWVDEMIA